VGHLRARGATVIERPVYWMVTCPAHDDHSPSLKVRAGQTQPVVLHCFAECHADSVLVAAGLSWSDVLARSEARARALVVQGYRCGEHEYDALDDGLLSVVFDLKPPQVERDYVEGMRAPNGALLVEQPKRAGKVMRAVLEDVAELVRERMAQGETRPVPYGSRWLAARLSSRLGVAVDDRRGREA
jgi:hypothetical protein